MIQFLRYKSLPIILSLLVLTAGSGLLITKHFCEGNLKSISLLPAKKSCCSSTEESPCCNNTTQLIQADVDLQITPLTNIDFSSIALFTTQNFTEYIEAKHPLASVFVYLPQKIPPLLGKDICILMQRFLL